MSSSVASSSVRDSQSTVSSLVCSLGHCCSFTDTYQAQQSTTASRSRGLTGRQTSIERKTTFVQAPQLRITRHAPAKDAQASVADKPAPKRTRLRITRFTPVHKKSCNKPYPAKSAMKQPGAAKPKKSVRISSIVATRILPKAAPEDKSMLWFQPDIGTKKPVAWKQGSLNSAKLKDYPDLWKSVLLDDGSTLCGSRLPNTISRFRSVQKYYKRQDDGEDCFVFDQYEPVVQQSPFPGFYGKRIGDAEWNGFLLQHSCDISMPPEAFGRCQRTRRNNWLYLSEAYQENDGWYRKGVLGKQGAVRTLKAVKTEDPELPHISEIGVKENDSEVPSQTSVKSTTISVSDLLSSSSLFSEFTRQRFDPRVLSWVREQILLHEGQWSK